MSRIPSLPLVPAPLFEGSDDQINGIRNNGKQILDDPCNLMILLIDFLYNFQSRLAGQYSVYVHLFVP